MAIMQRKLNHVVIIVKKQPVFLDLTKIYLPVTALVSIMHRVSGVFLFLLMPVWALITAAIVFNAQLSPLLWLLVKITLFVSAILYLYHLSAGARHIVAEVAHMHTLSSSRTSAWMTLVIWGVLSILLTLRVWL